MSVCAEFAFVTMLAWASYVDLKTFTIPDFIPRVGVLLGLVGATIWPNSILLKERISDDFLNFKQCLPLYVNEQSPVIFTLCLFATTLWVLSEFYFFPALKPRRGLLIALRISCRKLWRSFSSAHYLCLVCCGVATGIGAVFLVHLIGGRAWLGLSSSLLGSLFGMVVVWVTRILANTILRQEALGYGDVVFVGMMGSWLGWQPTFALLALAAPVALLLIVTLQKIIRRSTLAFGPALAISAIVVRYSWSRLEDYTLSYIHMTVDLSYYGIAVVGGGVLGFCCLLIAARYLRLKFGSKAKEKAQFSTEA